MKKRIKVMFLIGILILGLFLLMGLTGTERSLHVLSCGYLYHDGTISGVSTIPIPTSGHPEKCLVQPIGSSIRHMSDGIGPVTGTTGFVIPANDYFELESGDIIRDWGFNPPPSSGVTLYYEIVGIPG